jgi:hypothetical protein
MMRYGSSDRARGLNSRAETFIGKLPTLSGLLGVSNEPSGKVPSLAQIAQDAIPTGKDEVLKYFEDKAALSRRRGF